MQPLPRLDAGRPRFWEPALGTKPAFALLVTDPALPTYLHTPFVWTHYRAHLTLRACGSSIFMIHNQTVNIWTHLLPAMAFLVYSAWQIADGTATLPLLTCCLANSFIFVVSTFAHVFSPINALWHRRCWAADWSAIAFAIFGHLFPICYYAFADHEGECVLFGALLVVSCGAILMMANSSYWATLPNYQKALLGLSPLPVTVAMLCRIAAVLSAEKSSAILSPLAPLGGLIASGLSVYASRVPERWFPGRFDPEGCVYNIQRIHRIHVYITAR
jgi:adiponectin receptor